MYFFYSLGVQNAFLIQIAEKKIQNNQTFSFFGDQKTSEFFKRYLSGNKLGKKKTEDLKNKYSDQSERLKQRMVSPESPQVDSKVFLSSFFNRPFTSISGTKKQYMSTTNSLEEKSIRNQGAISFEYQRVKIFSLNEILNKI